MKKILSIILAAVIILSLVPSVFAEEAAEAAAPIVYDFDAESASGVENFAYTDTRNWSYFAMSEELQQIYDSTTSQYTVAGIGGAGLQMRLTSTNYETIEGSQWVALKIKVPTAGIYEVSYTAVTKKGYCSDGFLNILPGSYKKEDLTYDICKSNSFASSINYATTSSTTADSIVTVTNVLTAEEDNGEFIFVIGNNDSATGYMVLRNLTLTKLSDAVNLDEDVINLNIGDTQTVTATLASGKKLLACSAVEYSVADTTVADVDANGKVTAKKSGSTTLTARIGDAEKTIPLIVGYKYDFTPGEYTGAPTRLEGIKAERYSDYESGRNWKYENMSEGMHTRYTTESTSASPKYYQVLGFNSTGLQFNSQTDKADWVAFKIKVPEKGLYYANCVIYQRNSSSYCTNGYLSMLAANAPAGDFTIDRATLQQFLIKNGVTFKTSGDAGNTVVATTRLIAANEDGAEFTFMAGNGNDNGYIIIDSLTLVKADDEIKLDKSEINLLKGKTETVTAALENHDAFIGGSKPSYSIPEADSVIATVSEKGVVTAVGAGETTLTATIGNKTATIPITVTAPAEDSAAENNVSFVQTTNIAGFDSIDIRSVARGTSVELTAHKQEIEGYKFIGWKRGADAGGENVWVDISGDAYAVWTNTYLTAIYEKETDVTEKSVEFWNQNGAYIGKMDEATYNAQDTLFTPKLTGFGTFLGWFTDENVEFTAGQTLPLGTTNAVAQYNASAVAGVKRDGEAVEGATEYNKKIELRKTNADFTCWMRDGKTIGYDDVYTYHVWGATNITEGTETISDKVPVAILEYSEDHDAYMLEYDAGDYEIAEAGIIFGNGSHTVDSCDKKFTSQRKVAHNQFTAPAESGKTALGYIIYTLDDGATYKVKYITTNGK